MILGKWWISQHWTLKVWLDRVPDHLVLVMLYLPRKVGPRWGLRSLPTWYSMKWTWLMWEWHRMGLSPCGWACTGAAPRTLWTHLPWVAAEGEAPSLCQGSCGLSVYKGIWSFAKAFWGWDRGESSSVTFLVATCWENQGCCSWQLDLVIACGLCLAWLCRGANYCK